MKKIFFISLIFSFSFGLTAQELGLHFMNNVYQSGYTNPGKIMESRFQLGLPSFAVNYGHNGPSIGDMLITRNGENIIDIDLGLAQLNDNNFLHTKVDVETFNIAFPIGRLQLGLSHAVRNDFALGYPRELPEMAFNGNVQYIDQTVNVGLSTDITSYSELAIHGAFKISDKLSVGGRFKLLSGLGNISTKRSDLSIYTDPEYYQLTATSDYVVQGSGTFYDLQLYTTPDSSNFNIEILEDLEVSELIFSKNTGVAFDLGVTYKINDKITLEASILDLGGNIEWKDNASIYTSNGTYTFDGVNADDVFFGEDSLDFDGVLDTMVQLLGFEETGTTYTTKIGSKFYLSGTYNITKTFSAGAVLYGNQVLGKFRPAFGLSVQKKLGRVLSIGGVYSIRNNSFANLGGNFALNLGGLQIYAASDNLLTAFRPLDSKNVNFRFGINIAVRQKKESTADNKIE